MSSLILALDQGTTSSRAILFDRHGDILCQDRLALTQHYPRPGWVEHDAEEIWSTQLKTMSAVLQKSRAAPGSIAGIGIANQRETVIVWDKETGKPVCPAIVWQCRRTAEACARLRRRGLTGMIAQKTGLVPDPYFSGTKLRWILDNIPGARAGAEAGRLLFGTVDSWLIWNLTGVHVTDYSNAGRTMLFDIHRLEWDRELCALLDIPMAMLPAAVENSMVYGHVRPGIPGIEALAGVPVCGSAGDQQAALFGQACFDRGQAKNTYGTGCFTLLNTGEEAAVSANGLLTSVGWRVGGRTSYVLEGSVFNAGSAIQWLRDELGVISTAHECDLLAESVPDSGGVYMVPAFSGLGAPDWDPYARGAILGLTRGSTKAHLARAVLEGIAFQVADLTVTMARDTGTPPESLWVDGGASVSDFLMQFQADLLGCRILRPAMGEATALGAAFFAGLAAGVWDNTDQLRHLRRLERTFSPACTREAAAARMQDWRRAVDRTKNWIAEGE